MIKPKLLVTALVVILLFAKANAQDTTHYDLGRIQLKKDFTQSVTVKGEDLAKMPFTNLAEAINVWFYGSYSNSSTLVYVIDGNLVNDVNAYSIYDIDEVTLIQNAVTHIAGISQQQQQMVLIKTKRSKVKGSGVTAVAQADISKLYTNNIRSYTATPEQVFDYQTGLKTSTTLYQQYYVSAYQNTGNIQFGVSADLTTDGLPQIKNDSYINTESFKRLKLNGYFDANIGKSVLDFTAGYTPQTINYNTIYDNPAGNYNEKDNSHIFNTSVKLNTPLLPNLINTIHADYNNDGEGYKGTYIYNQSDGSGNNNQMENLYNGGGYSHTIVAYDNLNYDAKFKNWALEPAINFSYRKFRDSVHNQTLSNYNSVQESVSSNFTNLYTHVFLLTPSINLYYKTYFNIEGGMLYNLTSINGIKPNHKLFPFISSSADVARLINPASNIAVKVFGSYADDAQVPENFVSLPDFDNTNVYLPELIYTDVIVGVPAGIYNSIYLSQYHTSSTTDIKSYHTLSAGLTLTPLKSGFTFNYFFEKSNYLSPLIIFVPAYVNTVQEAYEEFNTNTILHRLSVDYAISNSQFNWHTGINATTIKRTYDLVFEPNASTGGNEWTGGWANRLAYRNFFGGVDVLYFLGTKNFDIANGNVSITKFNSISLQNVYAGYRMKTSGFKNLEVFATGRNIFQNQKENITDSRKYYGLGLKFSL